MARVEKYYCPEDFQQRLTDAGGLNPYDEPLFRLVWGQTETFRAGGIFDCGHEAYFRGYRDMLLGEACWILQQWQPAIMYGSPASYYMENYDESSDLQTLGEYPFHGRYKTIKPFIWRGLKNGRPISEHLPLSNFMIDLLIPMIHASKKLTMLKRMQLTKESYERQRRSQVARIEDKLRDASPAFGIAARSASRLECNSVVQRKAESIEKYYNNAIKLLRARGKGLSVGSQGLHKKF